MVDNGMRCICVLCSKFFQAVSGVASVFWSSVTDLHHHQAPSLFPRRQLPVRHRPATQTTVHKKRWQVKTSVFLCAYSTLIVISYFTLGHVVSFFT